jgi:hypothetical protein
MQQLAADTVPVLAVAHCTARSSSKLPYKKPAAATAALATAE